MPFQRKLNELKQFSYAMCNCENSHNRNNELSCTGIYGKTKSDEKIIKNKKKEKVTFKNFKSS